LTGTPFDQKVIQLNLHSTERRMTERNFYRTGNFTENGHLNEKKNFEHGHLTEISENFHLTEILLRQKTKCILAINTTLNRRKILLSRCIHRRQASF
jgi:hypothetical protein